MKTCTCNTLLEDERDIELRKLNRLFETITTLNTESSFVLKEIREMADLQYDVACLHLMSNKEGVTKEKYTYLKARANVVSTYADAVLKSRGDFS